MLKERIETAPGQEAENSHPEDVVEIEDLDSSITPLHLSLFFQKHPGCRAVRVVDGQGAPIGRLTREVVFRLLPPKALRSTQRGLQQVDHLAGGLTWPQVPRFRCPVCGFEDDYPLHNRRKPVPDCPLIPEHGSMTRLQR